MIKPKYFLSLLLLNLLFIHPSVFAQKSISLAGKWFVQIDSLDEGIQQQWFNHTVGRIIQLPGTLDDAGIGKPTTLSPDQLTKDVVEKLTRKHSYIGAAWYVKEFDVPAEWANQTIHLYLERVIWKTNVWIDGKEAGEDESLSTPHVFVLTNGLSKGKHRIAIRIDNRKQYDVSYMNMAHAYTDGTQIIWNGIIGKIELNAGNKLFVKAIKTIPHLKQNAVTVQSYLVNNLGTTAKATLTIKIAEKGNKQLVRQQKVAIDVPTGEHIDSVFIPLGKNALHWDEFNPNLYTVSVQINKGNLSDVRQTSFGLREITNDNGFIQINGRRIFIRGTLECNIFPLTGHPPMEKKGWLKVFNTAKSYGLNHLRFHSWCPPEAAFEVADSLGFYLQVELPFWNKNAGKDEKVNHFLEREAERISLEYGNHPSFCFWSMGNELEGDFSWLAGMVNKLRSADPRHLYTSTTFSFQKDHGTWPEKADDYYITQYTKKGWVRGQGIFNTYPPNFASDYSKAVEGLPVPIITHEMGQYSVYPNLKEISKYTGVLDPLNFKAIENDLKRKQLIDLAPAFTLASGKFSALLYKEEIERILKTRHMSGFQLLDLHDFPGQGTALVGLLDAFWDSKGLVTPEEHRMYCSAVVPLLRYSKATYTSNETFEATAEVANFSNHPLINATAFWTVTTANGQVLFNGKLKNQTISIGNGIDLGKISFDLAGFTKATELTIQLGINGTDYKNKWNIWVYPATLNIDTTEIKFTNSPKEALQYLAQGKKVLLNPDTANIKGVEGRFAPVFWSPVHFPNQPGTMGILCNPQHPALKNFPTEFYSNWQWWDLIKSSKTMILDSVPNLKPIVRVIDNFFKNRKMANVIEANVGKGKLMLVSVDLTHNLDKRPAARQLLYSLIKYMKGKDFSPKYNLTPEEINTLVSN